eukprot:gene13817-17649_t
MRMVPSLSNKGACSVICSGFRSARCTIVNDARPEACRAA